MTMTKTYIVCILWVAVLLDMSDTGKLRARSMMQSKRYKGALHATNSVRYSDNCIRRNSLQLGRLPGSRRSLSPNLTTDVVVMLENNLSGRPRCFTTTSTTSTLAATTTENSLKVPLISINGPASTGVPGSEIGATTTDGVIANVNSINRSISRENNHSTASTPLASSQASSNLSIDELNHSAAATASKQHQLGLLSEEQRPASQASAEDNANRWHHHPQLNLHHHQHLPSSHQLINGYESGDDDKSSPHPIVDGDIPCRNGLKRETCI